MFAITLEQQEIKNRFYWLISARLIIFTIALTLALILSRPDILSRPEIQNSKIWLLSTLFGLYIFSFIYWIIFLKRKILIPLLYTQFFIDTIIVTIIVWFTLQGIESQFILLYFLIVMASSTFLQVRGGIIVASMAGLSLTLLMWYYYNSVFAPVLQLETVASREEFDIASDIILRVCFYVAFFYILASVSGFLSEKANRKSRELADANIRLKHARLNTDEILRNLTSGLITLDAECNIVAFNRAAETILGFSEEDIKGKSLDEAFGDSLTDFVRLMKDVLQKDITLHRFDMHLHFEDGRNMPLGISASTVSDEELGKRGAIIVFQDLTEEKRLEEQIRRADRLIVVGELSAGIAHEIRNPLASIRGSIEMLLEELELEDENKRLMNLIIRESERLNTIISDFLEFARIRSSKLEKVHLLQVLDDVFLLLSNHPIATKKEIQVIRNFPIEPIYIKADEEQMRQMFFNICLNAYQFIELKGNLSITIEKVEHNGVIEAKISIIDNGPGFPNSIRHKIFEPFHTTRKNGTGLGLAIVNRIIENHKGEIEVFSKEGEGTTFMIFLPIWSQLEGGNVYEHSISQLETSSG